MESPPRTPQPGRMRLLWIGNLVLTLVFVVLAITADSTFSRILGLALAAVTLLLARAWFRQERLARRRTG